MSEDRVTSSPFRLPGAPSDSCEHADMESSYFPSASGSSNLGGQSDLEMVANGNMFFPAARTDSLADSFSHEPQSMRPIASVIDKHNCYDYSYDDLFSSVDNTSLSLASIEPSFSPRPPPPAAPAAPAQNLQVFGCQCHGHAIQQLIQLNLFASSHPNSSSSPSSLSTSSSSSAASSPYMAPSSCTINTIETCQKGLQQLVNTILQCSICSSRETHANLLMLAILGIDNLVTMLETTILARDLSSESESRLGFWAQYRRR